MTSQPASPSPHDPEQSPETMSPDAATIKLIQELNKEEINWIEIQRLANFIRKDDLDLHKRIRLLFEGKDKKVNDSKICQIGIMLYPENIKTYMEIPTVSTFLHAKSLNNPTELLERLQGIYPPPSDEDHDLTPIREGVGDKMRGCLSLLNPRNWFN